MKYVEQGARFLVIVQVFNQMVYSLATETGDSEESQDEEPNNKQGSWSHWWSYDGISGPDYWNINKRWRLCNSGRKQSPVNVRTERLVFDHLLGPIRLSWLEGERAAGGEEAAGSNADPATGESGAQDALQRPLDVEVLNSGRGIEAWLESGNLSAGGAADRLILSHGPLSYAYQLFKIELHSALPASGSSPERAESGEPEGATGEERVPEALRSGRTSEHLIDGRHFDAELQLHFYNRQLARSAARAQQLAHLESRANLFAAVSVLVEKRPDPSVPSSPLDFMLDRLGAVRDQGKSVSVRLSRSHIEALVPERAQYVTYQGSQNRPPCAESVDWILVNRALRVGESKLRALFGAETNTNQENIRPINALNRRLLRTTINNLAQSDQRSQPHLMGAPSSESAGLTGLNCSRQESSLDSKWNAAKVCSMKPHYAYKLRV